MTLDDLVDASASGGKPTVAVVGAGPSGFYAAEALLKAGVTVALIERLPTPFGLVRYGVAPDHPKLKLASLAFEKVAMMPGFHFFGGVELGKTISLEALRACFHAVVIAYGASDDKKLDIPGEGLPGSHNAAAFVAWYNGHPDFRDHTIDLSGDSAVIIGNGNVALDIARILAKPIDALKDTDIARHALEQLAESRIRDIHIVGRRGPAHARFSSRELAEMGSIAGCHTHCTAADLAPMLSNHANAPIAVRSDADATLANLTHFHRFSGERIVAVEDTRRTVQFHFFKVPHGIEGRHRVEGMTFRKVTPSQGAGHVGGDVSEQIVSIPTQLVIRAVGYRGRPVPGLPFDDVKGVVPTVEHRVVDDMGTPLEGLYATGWIKRGPTGIIGHNRADSVEVVKTLLLDLSTKPHQVRGGIAAFTQRLTDSNTRAVDFADWQSIDNAEKAAGLTLGRPREKFTRIEEMLGAIKHASV